MGLSSIIVLISIKGYATKLFMANKIEEYLSNKSISKDPDSSTCDSIDKISKQEIEGIKKEIVSKLNVDYETYIKQF